MAVSTTPDSNPFYIQVTNVKETFTTSYGTPAEYDFPMVTLPPGTVLFRGVKIPNSAAGDDVRYFYKDYLGNPEGRDKVCLSPTHNTFFYPFPYVAFGAHNVGKTFQSMQAVVLVHPMTVIAAVAPAGTVRGDSAKLDGEAPWQRCDKLADFACHPLTEKELDALKYDACLHPKYQLRTNVRGWMAIADLDALRPSKEIKESRRTGEKYTAKKSSMGSYLRQLEARQPGLAAEAMCWLFADKDVRSGKARRAGFPEIALYPYRVHPGEKTIVRKCRDSEQAIMIMAEEAEKNNLNYLPLAAFTKDGITDMVNGHFSIDCVEPAADTFTIPVPEQQGMIEMKMNQWLNMAQKDGIQLPFYGKSKLHFDTRTGFFVLPNMIPKVLRVPVPTESVEEGKKADIPYRYLLLPLETADDRRRVMTYMLLFRTFIPGKVMQMFGLEKKFGVRRAMVFERPPVLNWLFTELEIKLPEEYQKIIRRAAQLYQEDTGEKSKLQLQKEAEAAAKLAVVQAPAMLGLPGPKEQNFNLYDAAGVKVGAYTRQDLYALTPEQILEMMIDAGREEEAREDMGHPKYFGASIPEKVAGKRKYLFKWILMERGIAEQDLDDYLNLLMMDDVAMFSVTESEEADKQAKMIRSAYAEIAGISAEEAALATITDSSACVGGNSIAFCDNFAFVNAVEMSVNRAQMLMHNLTSFQFDYKNFSVHCADYTKIMNSLKQDIIFFDPPWGGTSYKEQETVQLKLGDMDVGEIVASLAKGRKARLIALKVPTNFDIDGFTARLMMDGDGARVDTIVPMKKMNLILIEVPAPSGPSTPMLGEGTPVLGGEGTPVLYPGGATPPLYGTGEATPPLYAFGEGELTPRYGMGASTPPFTAAYAPASPAYAPASPAYAPASPAYAPASPAYLPGTPPYTEAGALGETSLIASGVGQEAPVAKTSPTLPPSKGGRRTTRSRKTSSKRRTPRRKQISDRQHEFAKGFPAVWKAFVKNLA